MQAAGIIKLLEHATPLRNSSFIVDVKQIDKHGRPQLHILLDPSNLNQNTQRHISILEPWMTPFKNCQKQRCSP